MKKVLRLLNILFRPRGLASLLRSGQIIIALLLFSVITIAQESPPSEFVLDGSMEYKSLWIDPFYNSYIDCGFNTMIQRANDSSKSLLDRFHLHALNAQDSLQLIYYYSSSYYSKWEAEEDQQNDNMVGVKHSVGDTSTWKGIKCWSTKGMTGPASTLVYGPTYHQEKWYRRWYEGYNDDDRYNLQYTPRFRMALHNPHSVLDTQDVCRIYVILKYGLTVDNVPSSTDSIDTLKEPVTLKVSDFPPNGDFDYIYFSDFVEERSYKYPSCFRDPAEYKLIMPDIEGTYCNDREGGQGVQFCIDWLRTDTLCTLYIDNIEVYDNNGWNYYVNNPELIANDIKTYAQNFSNWSNIKYWIGGHEPSSIDSYIPIKTVNTILVDSAGAQPIMNVVWAYWKLKLNGESQLERYYNMVQPNKLMVEFHPILASYDIVRPFDLEVLRKIFQESYRVTQGSKFYYHAQSYGEWDDINHTWHIWRFPSLAEHKATIMLALAHGADGITQAQYDSYTGMKGIIRDEYENYDTTEIWYSLRYNIIPRLKGKLGKTLLSLNYTGDTLGLRRYLQVEGSFTNTNPTVTNLYLTLSEYTEGIPPPVHFHAGFFSRPQHPLDNYFMLDNLITTDDRWVNVTVGSDCSSRLNNRFRNIEPELNFDTTFTCNFSIDMLFPPGEGYLFEVAPVVIYGGKLIYPETISNETTLFDEMIIQNGATLTVNSTYNIDRDIRIKAGGSIITTTGGTLQFNEGHKLIVEGAATLQGTASHKLIIDFVSPENSNGIIINPGGSLNISYCEVKNAAKGINSEINANYLNAQYVDFIDCDPIAINIEGRSPGMAPTPPPQIKFCTLTNSPDGIFVANLSEIIIQENIITNSDLGISLLDVTNAQIIDNQIHSNTEELQGILSLSSGGVIRGNNITGHTVGIHLGNSSPKLGDNTLSANKYHGLYIGVGSVPYMTKEIIGNPPNAYILSGYNKIEENGGWQEVGGPPDNDGSEIFFYNSNAIMINGCNSIMDDREPSPPLVNTLLLMNCPSGSLIFVKAEHNYWGDTVYAARFGHLNVNYIPYEVAPCPEPSGGEDELVLKTSFGEVIDTIYSTGDEVTELTETELAYAEAEEYFVTGDFTGAIQIYENIITGSATEEEKYLAYERKYEIGRLTSQSPEFFNAMGNTFNTLAANAEDSIRVKIFMQLSTLCKVGEEEYVPAIGEFDEIVQQNPNTEEGVYAEIDALTTALLVEDEDSSLHKGRLGKYLVKTSGDYNKRVDDILRKNFGRDANESEKDLLPTEYTLYQNYPNPFNPVTTIKYDLPNASDVSLIIYDILGRRVKQLVNDKQQPGRYEIKFDASNLASGVYIYQLIADKYINAKKMILLK